MRSPPIVNGGHHMELMDGTSALLSIRTAATEHRSGTRDLNASATLFTASPSESLYITCVVNRYDGHWSPR